MQVYFIGCRASLPAVEKYMHTAFAIEINDAIYWFDAGECCAHTAHLMGVDLLKIKEIFISHPHMDHIGGLGNLLWNIRKLTKTRKTLPVNGNIGLHISDMGTWEGLWKLLKNTQEAFEWDCKVIPSQIIRGDVYSDENIAVSAVHNRHMEKKETDIELSFSMKICCDGKTIIYSGDIKNLSELDELLQSPCDYLLIENAHQKIEEICAYANEKQIGTLVFLHHSKNVMENMQQYRIMAQNSAKCRIYFAEDGDRLTI